MNVGFMGLGKLGLPVALAVESRGHRVLGHDPAPQVNRIVATRTLPYQETHAPELLTRSRLELVDVDRLATDCDLVFVAIQTPHEARYEGITRIPGERVDFDYSHLREGIAQLSKAILRRRKPVVVIVVSTVLPGTIRREIEPMVQSNPWFRLCYNPFFIAMGTTIDDFLDPEFVLFGVKDPEATALALEFYRTIHDAPVYRTTIENAEAIKVLYNTYISTKIGFANTVMELCHKLHGADVDEVMAGIRLGTRRIISGRYLDGGMGDGGACHPRDNIALSWLARQAGMSHDWFSQIMLQRERQTEWLARMIVEEFAALRAAAPADEEVSIYLLGKAFKAETNIITGSPAVLLRNLIEESGYAVTAYDPFVDDKPPQFGRGVYFVATRHACFASFGFPAGSVVLDPWRFIPKDTNTGVTIIPIGRPRHSAGDQPQVRPASSVSMTS